MYFRTRLKIHFLNVLKYSISISVTAVSTAYKAEKSSTAFFVIFIALSIISAVYSYSWDILIDWGLLRSCKRGRWLLWDKILFPACFYYIAAFLDLIFRFVWVLSLYTSHVLKDFWGIYFQVFLTDIIEWFRRSLWAALRLENENINNF